MALDRSDFEFIRDMVYDRSGIVLDECKEYLIETRLGPVLRSLGVTSISQLVSQMRGKVFGKSHKAVIEAMTTNETSFFRDIHPFETLKKNLIPELIQRRSKERALNIWCAASSSGQEPYSISMLLRHDFPQLSTWRTKIIATDISQEMIDRARAGVYSQLEVNRGLPAPLLVKYFTKEGMVWQLKDEIRKMVEYKELNLTENFPPMAQMDMVFIRNVLIYFNLETKRSILQKISRVLKDDGYLFLGGAETTINIDDSFERHALGKTVCYRKKATVTAGAM